MLVRSLSRTLLRAVAKGCSLAGAAIAACLLSFGVQAKTVQLETAAEGIAAFKEKRTPEWKER